MFDASGIEVMASEPQSLDKWYWDDVSLESDATGHPLYRQFKGPMIDLRPMCVGLAENIPKEGWLLFLVENVHVSDIQTAKLTLIANDVMGFSYPVSWAKDRPVHGKAWPDGMPPTEYPESFS